MNALAEARGRLDAKREKRAHVARRHGFALRDDTVQNRFKMGVYAYLIQNSGGTPEQVQKQFERRAENLRSSVRKINDPSAFKEQREKAMFISVQAWRGLAENAAQSVRKGQRVVIQGRLDLNQWEADDGTARSKHRVIASDIASSMMFGTTEFTRVDRRAAAQIAANTEEPQGEAPPDAQQTPGAQGGEEPF